MNYFEARRAEQAMKEYKDLAVRYWNAKPKVERTGYEWMSGSRMQDPDSDDSFLLREKLSKLYPSVSIFSQQLGVPTGMVSYPAPAVGGPVIRGDVLNCVIDQHLGHSSVSRQEVLDAIDKCIGMAESIQSRLFWKQAVNPLYYLILTVAYLIRIPFLILEQAGLPEEVEHTLWGHIIKVVILVGVALLCVRFGLNITLKDLIAFVK